MFRLLVRNGGELVKSLPELANNDSAVRALERVRCLPRDALKPFQFKVLRGAVEAGEENRLVRGRYEWSEHSRAKRFQAVCTQCLRETGYGRSAWEWVQAPVCTLHGIQLSEHCSACSAPLGFNRVEIGRCASCAVELKRQNVLPVDALAMAGARLVQEPRTGPFGTATYTVPLEPQELAGLARLLLVPVLGEGVDFGLVGNLEGISVERRIQALRLLGSSLVGKRIDANLLRINALARWPYASLLAPDEQMRLLYEACCAVGLLPEMARVLCWGTDQSPYPTAASVFEGRPPQLRGLWELAEHLDLELVDLNDLLRHEQFPEPEMGDLGFDMDAVMGLERVLRSMPSSNQADSLLGWPGVANELVAMGLLAAVCTADGAVGIHPRSISRLFGRVHERVGSRRRCSCNSVLLRESEMLGMDARQFAWTVAQVVGGTLAVHDWLPPFNLSSLMVCERRLRELANWPAAEAGAQRGCASVDFIGPPERSHSFSHNVGKP